MRLSSTAVEESGMGSASSIRFSWSKSWLPAGTEEAAVGGWIRGDTSCMKAPLAVKGHFSWIFRLDFRRWDTLQASRTEDRAPRGRDLSAEPEAGICEARPQGRLAPDAILARKRKNPGVRGKAPAMLVGHLLSVFVTLALTVCFIEAMYSPSFAEQGGT